MPPMQAADEEGESVLQRARGKVEAGAADAAAEEQMVHPLVPGHVEGAQVVGEERRDHVDWQHADGAKARVERIGEASEHVGCRAERHDDIGQHV